MKVKNLLKSEEKDFFTIWDIIKKRKFEGYTGQAIKNSIYQFSTTFIGKIGSLIFTIIVARLLMPELFGLYSLALSTIILFVGFSELGVSQALIRHISKFLGKNKEKKAKAYTLYLLKVKLILILITSIVLTILAKFIAVNYYNKPIFLALIVGAFYIISIGLLSFIDGIFFASNKFKYPFYKEIIFQILRLVLVPLAILSIITSTSTQSVLFLIILTLSTSYFISLIFMLILIKKKIKFLQEKTQVLTKKEKRNLIKFMLPLSATVLSGVFFGYIDIIMLGRYVLAEYIGFYKAGFSLIGALIPFVGFSGALFPLFSRLKGERLERGFKKSIRITLLLSSLAMIGTLIFAGIAIKLIFGQAYLPAANILRVLSLLLISIPLSMLYNSYLISQGKTKIVAKLLITSTIINIILNYLLITWLVQYSFSMAVMGAAIATIISRYLYLFLLILLKKS